MKIGYDLVEPYVIDHYYCFGHLISVSKKYCYTKNIIYIYFFSITAKREIFFLNLFQINMNYILFRLHIHFSNKFNAKYKLN